MSSNRRNPGAYICVISYMKRFLYLVLYCLSAVASNPSSAQEEFIEPSRELATVPFIQLTGGIIIMQAKLDNFPDTLNFVLDTGSSGISLDSATVSFLGLKPVPTDKTIRGIAGIRKVSFLYNRKLHFPGITVDSLNFHINDYSILTEVYGEQIDGIIGYSLISRYILKVDYDSMRITFCSPGTMRYPRGGYLMKPTITQLVTQPFRIRDEKALTARFLYDMGAGLCMLYSKEFIADSNFMDKKKKKYIKQGEGLGGKIDMELTVIREVKIGPYRFRNVPVFIFDDQTNITQYPQLGGLMGNDLLRRFNVILNYGKGDIYLMPNKHYSETFDYSYSGMELYYVNGKIIAGDVAKDSPAEAAGVKEGDEILAVNKSFNQNLNQYKIALQSPNEKVRLVIRREGVLIEIEFKVKSIY
jgi:hypothetical protein